MKKILHSLLAIASTALLFTCLQAQSVLLPNGWSLQASGTHLKAGDLPICMKPSPDGSLLYIINAGQSDHSLMIFDTKKKKRLDSIPLAATWYGMAVGTKGDLYITGANQNFIYHLTRNKGNKKPMFLFQDTIMLAEPWPVAISPSGLALNETEQLLYIVTKEDSSMYGWDLQQKSLRFSRKLPSAAYDCTWLPNTKQVVVSEWGNGTLSFWTATGTLQKRISCGDNPNEILADEQHQRLFVACADDNTVAVIDLNSLTCTEKLNTAMAPDAPTGSTPNALAMNQDRSLLFVCNADNNNIGVFRTGPEGIQSAGFIPTGWYPTQVQVIDQTLWYCSGKGLSSAANPFGPNPVNKRNKVDYQKSDNRKEVRKVQYIGSLFRGTVSWLPIPNEAELKNFTRITYQNTPYQKQTAVKNQIPNGDPIPDSVGKNSPIKHVFYIIKENRTYDQVLSDIPGGDGDTSLLLFGERITPNQHKLVKEFVLLDHFYVEAEVSADGHNWSTAAYANDYTEKTWPVSYGGRGGNYDYEGQKEIAWPQKGFIWDHCRRENIPYRTYGEFADDFKANIPSLEGNFCPYFTSWDERIRDTTRFNQWRRDFDSLVAINKVPALNTLRFINDHTEGTRVGRPTPYAHVADNDYAVGLFVEYLSQSPVWDSSAVFILEDDAQNGPDHIDAHRSTAYVAGPHVRRNFIDHTPYTTSSMLRTIELILGIPPMSQYDAAAMPMWRCFTDSADYTPFKHLAPNINLNDINTGSAWHNLKSEEINLSKEDRVPDALMNEILWKALKGASIPLPAISRAAWVITSESRE